MLTSSMEYLPEYIPRVNHKPSTKRFGFLKTSKSKGSAKMSRTASQTFDEHEREDLVLVNDCKTDKEREALDNLRSLNDDSGTLELENEIQNITENLPIQYLQRMNRDLAPRAINSSTQDFMDQHMTSEPVTFKGKESPFKLPIISILKKTLASRGYQNANQIPTGGNNNENISREHTKVVSMTERKLSRTQSDLSPAMMTKSEERNMENIDANSNKKPSKRKKARSKSRITGQKEKFFIQSQEHLIKSARTGSITPTKKEGNSLISGEEMPNQQMQRNTVTGTSSFKKITMKSDKIGYLENMRRSNTMVNTDGGMQQSLDDKDFSFRVKEFMRSYLNFSREETDKQQEDERPLQGLGIKVIQLTHEQPIQIRRLEPKSLEDDYLRRSVYMRPRVETKDVGKLTDRDNSGMKSQRIEELKDFCHKALKPPVVNHTRENIWMQGFSIFKAKGQDNENKEKESEVNPLSSAPVTARLPVKEGKKEKVLHSRSKSSLLKITTIPKGPPLLYILGNDKEAKYKDNNNRQQPKNKNTDICAKKKIPLMLVGGSIQNEAIEARNVMAAKLKARVTDMNFKPGFEDAGINQKRVTRLVENNFIEKEAGTTSQLFEIKKEARPAYTPIRPLKPFYFCNK